MAGVKKPEMMIIMREGEDGLVVERESTPGVVTAAEVEKGGERKIGRIGITAGGCVVCGESVYQSKRLCLHLYSTHTCTFQLELCTLINTHLFCFQRHITFRNSI